jgi:hypothetical protein
MGFPWRAMSVRQAIDRFGDKMRFEADRIGAAARDVVASTASRAGRAAVLAR